jgi:outer membrane protein assembly factor BamE (lipoprotein component of BamABCDE complex)
MNLTASSLLLAVALVLAGCTSPAQTYARQHPELSAKQLEILNTGKIPDGDAIAGMTREQIQLAMGVEPAQYTKVDGQDAWVYVTRKLSPMNLSQANDATFNHQDNRSRHSLAEGESHAPSDQPTVRTTVYFQGNVATKADVVNGGL